LPADEYGRNPAADRGSDMTELEPSPDPWQRKSREFDVANRDAAAIVDSVADAIIAIGENGAIAAFNRSAERMFRYSAQEIVGEDIRILLASTYRDNDDIVEFIWSGTSKLHGSLYEAFGRCKDGSIFPIELSANGLASGEPTNRFGRISVTLIRDISERKELRRQVLEAAEQEQRRIGQDLHDGTQQELCGLGLIAEGLVESLEAANSPHAKTAARLSQGLGQALENVRILARGLVPATIRAHGLRVALAELARRTAESAAVDCGFDCDDGPMISDPVVVTHLYRIAQEAVTNVVRHAKAAHIQISLNTKNRLLTLSVTDDGTGISAAGSYKGIGLKAMFYRASMIGGALRVWPAVSGGTEVICSVPLE
jgi:two-component system, LuxR family, sensor kinase FixL